MTDSTDEKIAKPSRKKSADVDALLTEVTGKTAVIKAKPAKPAVAVEPKAEAAKEPKERKTVRIRQIRSGICAPVDQKQTLFGLGLRKIRQEVVRVDSPSLRGQIMKVRHLVTLVGE
jgi:large subunit ribosomal protein L30